MSVSHVIAVINIFRGMSDDEKKTESEKESNLLCHNRLNYPTFPLKKSFSPVDRLTLRYPGCF